MKVLLLSIVCLISFHSVANSGLERKILKLQKRLEVDLSLVDAILDELPITPSNEFSGKSKFREHSYYCNAGGASGGGVEKEQFHSIAKKQAISKCMSAGHSRRQCDNEVDSSYQYVGDITYKGTCTITVKVSPISSL